MLSIKYHAIFDYELVKSDFPKWLYKGEKTPLRSKSFAGQARIKREKISKQKLQIAKKAARILSKIPTIKFVGVTGSLAMMNSNENSDIDLMIITSQGNLWLSRLVILVLLVILDIPFRRAGKRDEANKLCLNMWFDESDLVWRKSDRNIYTSHEIAQIMPLANKDNTYEKFLYQNKWVLDFWPNAVRVQSTKYEVRSKNFLCTMYYVLCTMLEPIAFWLQHQYMRSKITREIVTPTRAIFHPNDWGKVVLKKLKI
jgi:hypothetical protein